MITDYDEYIKSGVDIHFPDIDWRFVKAQFFQESRLDKDAVSPVGARGISQFMPATWDEVSIKLGMQNSSPHHPEQSIYAGIFYLKELYDVWTAPRPIMDRYCLALASYNAGIGNLLAAQGHVGGLNLYCEIIQGLPHITGHHAQETKTYVERILKYYSSLVIRGPKA